MCFCVCDLSIFVVACCERQRLFYSAGAVVVLHLHHVTLWNAVFLMPKLGSWSESGRPGPGSPRWKSYTFAQRWGQSGPLSELSVSQGRLGRG